MILSFSNQSLLGRDMETEPPMAPIPAESEKIWPMYEYQPSLKKGQTTNTVAPKQIFFHFFSAYFAKILFNVKSLPLFNT